MTKSKEERQWRQLKDLGLKLRVPVPEVFLQLEVKDKNGNTIHSNRDRSHTWNRNAYNILLTQLSAINGDDSTWGAGYINLKDTDGVVRHGNFVCGLSTNQNVETSTTYGFRGAVGDDDLGIVVGSGAGAESYEDHALGSQITDGVGAGQLNHVASEPQTINYNAGTKTWTIVYVRYFNNNSGGDVNVNEVAIYTGAMAQNQAQPKMLTRDVLASTVVVPDTGQLKVTYTIEMTFPE